MTGIVQKDKENGCFKTELILLPAIY